MECARDAPRDEKVCDVWHLPAGADHSDGHGEALAERTARATAAVSTVRPAHQEQKL